MVANKVSNTVPNSPAMNDPGDTWEIGSSSAAHNARRDRVVGKVVALTQSCQFRRRASGSRWCMNQPEGSGSRCHMFLAQIDLVNLGWRTVAATETAHIRIWTL